MLLIVKVEGIFVQGSGGILKELAAHFDFRPENRNSILQESDINILFLGSVAWASPNLANNAGEDPQLLESLNDIENNIE